MSKKIRNIVHLKIPSGEASSKPPLGSTIGQFGVPIMDFCNLFNKISIEHDYKKGFMVNCILFVYYDFSFDVEIKNIDLIYLLKISIKDKIIIGKKNLSTKKGRVQSIIFGVKKRNNRKKKRNLRFFFLSTFSIYEISKMKYSLLNNNISFISYYKSVFGTCRSMGILVFPSRLINSYNHTEGGFLSYLLEEALCSTDIKKNIYTPDLLPIYI